MEVLQGATDCRPEETGYDSSRLDALNRHFQKLVDKKVIVGAEYTISHKGKIIANASVGGASKIDPEKQMKPDTVFHVASVTKTFTTVAIMQLIEDGYFRLDTLVGEILPQFSRPPFNDITVWHLLTHTSGLYPDPGCYPDVAPYSQWDYLEAGQKIFKGEGEYDWLESAISGGLRKPVGTQWMYCSFGFVVLGEIIAKVSGMGAEKYIEENIIHPLAMKDSGFEATIEMAERIFIRSEKEQKIVEDIKAGTYHNEAEGTIWAKVPRTGGGIMSTTRDLIRFGNMMLGNGRLDGVRILGRKTVEMITTPQLHNIPDTCWGAKEKDRQYGVGFDMKRGTAFSYSQGAFFHEGAGACSLDMDPKEQLCAAWFVPWDQVGWDSNALFTAQNIIWSGLI